MKTAVLTGASVVLCVGVAAFAVHFELSARTQAYHELQQLRGQARADLETHRITPTRATTLDYRLHEASLDLEEDDVRGAQKLLDGVKASLATQARSA
jgi:hypothetical protein